MTRDKNKIKFKIREMTFFLSQFTPSYKMCIVQMYTYERSRLF